MSKKYTVRVELHGVRDDSDDYERLHEKMEAGGFYKYLHYPSTKKNFALPTAEYRYFSDTETNKEVLDKAYDIANRVKRNPSVISTEGAIEMRGLEEI